MPESYIKCPICGRAVVASDPEVPFCSPRCRLLDLGNWASERYVILAPISEQDAEVDENAGEELQGEGE